MNIVRNSIAVVSACAFGAVSLAYAQQLSPDEQAAARTKVQTAVALAEIAEAEGDADALLVAARMLSSIGPVAKKGEALGDKPTLYSHQEMASTAKQMGADATKADAVATMSTAETEPTYCYWYYNCDSWNNCQWQYIC
jgi:hypothetical protein